MSVRGSKNKIILYIAGVCSTIFVILLYQNASTRLEEMGKLYERCHLNEESLSAQLQVNLEYKLRLEKSLQQEKSDLAQLKENLQNKLDDERQGRERENLEAVNKFSALQQQYKLLQSQHDDVNLEYDKLKQMHSTEVEEKKRLETLVEKLKDELRLVKDSKTNEIEQLKVKYDDLEKENFHLKESKKQLTVDMTKQEPVGSLIKLPDKFPLNTTVSKADRNDILPQPDGGVSIKSSTSAKKLEQELFPSGNNMYFNTSTPMINPDAVNSQDKILSAAPMPQPKQELLNNIPVYDNKENVGPKPDNMIKDRPNDEGPPQGVLNAPDIMKDFDHVPAIQQYKEKLRQSMDKNNAGEVFDDGDLAAKNEMPNQKQLWREGELQHHPLFVRQPVGNEIPKNPVYNYQAEYEGRKEEGEDDDDGDPLEYHNEKNPLQIPHQPHLQNELESRHNLEGMHVKIPFQDKRESVMIQPK